MKITPAYSSVSSVKRPSDNSSSELKCWSQLWQRVKLVRCLRPQPAWRSSPTAGESLFWGGGWQGRRGGQKGWKSPKLMPSSIHSRFSFLILSVISTDKWTLATGFSIVICHTFPLIVRSPLQRSLLCKYIQLILSSFSCIMNGCPSSPS